MPTDPFSPGRIDASVYLVCGLMPVPGAHAVMHAPLPQQPSGGGRPAGGGAAANYTRRIGGR